MDRYKSDTKEVKGAKRRNYVDMERFTREESVEKLREEPYQLKVLRMMKGENTDVHS